MNPWTPKIVADRLDEAASTLRRMPNTGLKPQGYKTSWPIYIQEIIDGCNSEEVMIKLGPPTPDAVGRMEECLEWFQWVEPDDRKLVWLRAERFPWKIIMRRIGCGRTSAWIRWMASLTFISKMLNLIDGKKCLNILDTKHFEQNLTK